MDPQNNKKHQKHSSGAKFNKKKADNKDKAKERGPSTKENNPKAFAIRSAVSAGQKLRRKLDLEVRKHHAPVLDRQQVSDTAAPFLVAIVGPPKSGKTTLIQSLVKHWTKKKIQEIKGPITIITGKNRRVTLFECPNNLNSMIDIAKVADLVLLLVDASFGFEMETFEFLNILQVHGFPKVMGVLTHLDLVKKSSALRRIKKDIKHRFWKEICKGAKVFYLSGIVFGKYLQREVINLSRFISVLRFKPSVWRSTHAGILVDRIEDITPEDQIMRDSTCDRRVCMYGFVRGTYLKKEQRVVVPGCGEFSMKSIVGLEDPCPLPDDEKKKKKRSLNQKERLLYAPMTDMGEIVYDKDAVYMHVPHKSIESDMHPYIEELAHNTRAIDNTLEETEGEFSFFGGKVSTSKPVEVKEFDQASGRVRRRAVFADETSNNNNDDDDDNVMEEDSDDNLEEDNDDEVPNLPKFDDDNVQEKVEFDDEWTNEDAEIFEESVGDVLDFYKKDNNVGSEAAEWKGNLIEKASERFNANKRVNLQELVYGSQLLSANKKDSEDSESDDELFKPVNSKKQNFDDIESVDEEDITKPLREADDVENDWDSEEARDAIKHKFAPEDWSEYNKEQAANPSRPDANQDDIEDLEKLTPAKKPSKPESNNMDISDSDDDDGNSRKKAKETKKSAFDSEYDNGGVQTSSDADGNSKATAQLLLNKTEFSSMDEFERAQYEGFRPGMYVKIELENMPAEFIIKHNPIHPVLIGGLNSSESRMGFIQVRLKKHRWHRKILKTRDPLIFSIGWRRFQSIPQYCIQDQNGRHRNIKYTPEHMHCIATFYGPVTPQNTGFIAFQTMSDQQSTFRVSATGYVMEFDQNFSIVKKLKLTGSPFKIFKNSAFIRGMFNSTLEVSRFQGAALRTVSGIRGSIKKPITEGVPGSFRAAFEDKILMSDIVFLRTWYPVPPIKFYNPVTNHLSPQWRAMKTVGMLRKERGLAIPRDKDAEYRPIARAPRRVETTAAVQIPRKMREELPFALRPTMDKQADDKTTIRLRQLDYIAPGNDKVKTNKMLKKLQIEATAAEQRRKEVQALKTEKRKKEQEREDMKKQQTIGRKRKAHFVKQGKADKKQKRN